MWLQLEAAAQCATCDATTAVNAAVGALSCDGCGASIQLKPALWDLVFDEVGALASELEANGSRSLQWRQGSAELRANVHRTAGVCPHCDQIWQQAPTAGMICPNCHEAISVRSRGALLLVSEDRALLEGQRGEVAPETLSCPSCAAPIRVDGSVRAPACEACGNQVFIPDEVWRRVHAPTQVAAWFLWLSVTGASNALPRCFSIDELVAVGDRLYGVGSMGADFSLFALATNPVALLWSTDLEQLGVDSGSLIAVSGEEVLQFGLMETTVRRFSAQTGELLGQVELPEEAMEMVGAPDGSWFARTHPLSALRRFSAQGKQLWLWKPPGCLGQLLGSKPKLDVHIPVMAPKSGMASCMPGRLGTSLDGDLRLVAADRIARFSHNGTMRWSVKVPLQQAVAIVAPAGAADGTTWAVLTGTQASSGSGSGSHLVRVSADGKDVRVVQSAGDGQIFNAVAVTQDGHVWLSTLRGLRRLDSDGNLLWRQG